MEKKPSILIKKSLLGFTVENTKTTILDGAIDANIILPHGCKSGACGSCVAKLIKGNVKNKDGKKVLDLPDAKKIDNS